jgi:hypothetical protein
MQRTFRCDPIQVSQWKRQLLDGASELFIKGKQTKDKDEDERQAKEAMSSDIRHHAGCAGEPFMAGHWLLFSAQWRE